MDTVKKAQQLREEVMSVAMAHRQGHIAPSLSCLDILTVLYYKVMAEDDVFILSKGHGCYGLYAIWADLGVIPKRQWLDFKLPGCLDGYGSLGHGLPVAVGIAFAKVMTGAPGHVYCIVGDGELEEGSCYEAINFMKSQRLSNITVIVDNNGLRAMDFIDRRYSCWEVISPMVNGHWHKALETALRNKYMMLIANTVKGKGYPIMESRPEWHYRCPRQGEL